MSNANRKKAARRRRYRETIIDLHHQINDVQKWCEEAKVLAYQRYIQLQTARADALEEFAKSHVVDYALKEIFSELAKALPKHLTPHAEKLFQMISQSKGSAIGVRATPDHMSKFTVLEGKIESLHYAVKIDV